MNRAKPPAVEGATASNRRAQPVRQTRVNPQRTSSLNRANALAGGPAPEQPINILPGVTHFSDAITALPRELVRHFTLLKEVDAKIFAPEAALFQLLHGALNIPAPDSNRPLNDTSSRAPSAPASTAAPNGSVAPPNPSAPPSEGSAVSLYDPANIPRRTIFRDTAMKIQEMLVSLEEKNHVIATANDALQKQLTRIDDVWPHLTAEFSEEAKYGSTTHWAYVENRQAKANDKQAERSRRDGAAALSAAAQQLAEEAAARSSDRKQAIAAKKNAKNQAAEADGDKAPETGKKGPGKSRKPLPDSGPAGPGAAGPGGAPATKRRKVETAKVNGAPVAERAMGAVFGANAAKQKTTSPRETPAPEGGGKKRKALPTSSNQAKKRQVIFNRTNAASATSSPVIGGLPDPKFGRGSPAPAAVPRPASSRARHTSTQSSVEDARQRPPSVASNKPNGNLQSTPDPGQPIAGAKPNTEAKTQKEAGVPVPSRPGTARPENEESPPMLEPAQNGSKETATKAGDEPAKKDTTALAIHPTPAAPVKTKSGRASKPSTPAIATFAEAAAATANTGASRSRPSRNGESGTGTANAGTTVAATTTTTTAKRSHKKGASVSVTAAIPQKDDKTHRTLKTEDQQEDEDEEEQAADDELRYCICHQVSYGEMVACDGEVSEGVVPFRVCRVEGCAEGEW
ncbi:hypothetical protein N0V88_000068 [Collariella sp. IMI 366227]|nr:hypothetical protein N0V88_000068 [Collariella sp. IMI 366227]